MPEGAGAKARSKARRDHEFRQRLKRGVDLICSLDGCPRKRHGVSPWCDNHKHQMRLHGSPTGRRLWSNDFAPFLDGVQLWWADHGDCEQAQAALFLMRDLIRLPQGHTVNKWVGDALNTLEAHECDHREALQKCAALYAMAFADTGLVERGQNLRKSCAFHVLRCHTTPYGGEHKWRAQGSVNEALGWLIERKLGTFLTALAVRVIRRQEQTQQALALVHAPLPE